jgi:hypothetical protein
MTAPSTVCPSCGEDVPFGRRTCEACGANLSNIASAHDEEALPPAADDSTGDAEQRIGHVLVDEPAVAFEPAGVPEPPAAVEPELEPEPVAAAEPEPESPPPFVPPVLRDWNAGAPTPETGFAAELAAAEGDPAGLAGAWLPPSAAPREPAPPATVSYAAPAAMADHSGPSAGSPPSGAMPASLAAMLNRPPDPGPRWPDAQASSATVAYAAAATEADDSMLPPSRMPDLGRAARYAEPAPADREPLQPGKAPVFADLPFDAPNTLAGWLVTGGGALATISFLLPWVPVIDSYFTSWGLGSIANLPAFLVVLGTTAMAILPSRLADWLRFGILGLAVGAFLLGLTWSRLVGATGGQLGVVLEGAGALLLLIGGILAIVRDRGVSDGGPNHR